MKIPDPVRKLGSRLNKGLLIILKPLQIVNNFLFLAIAYFVGVGISSLLYRLGPGKKIIRTNPAKVGNPVSGALAQDLAHETRETYWRTLPQVSRDSNAWLRPF